MLPLLLELLSIEKLNVPDEPVVRRLESVVILVEVPQSILLLDKSLSNPWKNRAFLCIVKYILQLTIIILMERKHQSNKVPDE